MFIPKFYKCKESNENPNGVPYSEIIDWILHITVVLKFLFSFMTNALPNK